MYAAKLPDCLRKQEFVITFRYGNPVGRIKMLVRDNVGADNFIFSEVFDHQYYRSDLIRKPKTILDLGANAGFTSVFFARFYDNPHIACVEPEPGNVRVLKENLRLNGVTADVFAVAVSTSDGSLRLRLDQHDYGHKIVDRDFETDDAGTVTEVPAVSVPTILDKLGWDRVGLLKVDIEGHEKELLGGNCDWMQRVDAMYIECHEGFGESDLKRISKIYGFSDPQALPGVWLLDRPSAALLDMRAA